MVRSFVLLFLSAAAATQVFCQRGTLDPAFEKIPFDQWLGEHDQARFRWSASVSPAELSFHQRLLSEIEVKLDGRDLEPRRGDGELVFFVQITDSFGTRNQNHGSLELSKPDANVKSANLEYSERAFFLPGSYRLAVAILDSATGEHSTRQAQFRVAAPPHDLLPGSWRDLPSVEFIVDGESPESWYLPNIKGRLQWASPVHSPARLNVILNVASSVPAPGSRPTPSSGLAALLPTLKVIAQTGSSSLSEHVELLDLARHRAVFDQKDVHDLDWPRLKTSLADANTASIDLHSLSEQHRDAQFFVSQVRSVLRAAEPLCVLVVLTASVAFGPGEDLEPISLEALPPCRVVYIRYRAPREFVRSFGQEMGGRRSRMGVPVIRNRPLLGIIDQLGPRSSR